MYTHTVEYVYEKDGLVLDVPITVVYTEDYITGQVVSQEADWSMTFSVKNCKQRNENYFRRRLSRALQWPLVGREMQEKFGRDINRYIDKE